MKSRRRSVENRRPMPSILHAFSCRPTRPCRRPPMACLADCQVAKLAGRHAPAQNSPIRQLKICQFLLMKNGGVAFFNQHRNRPPFARCATSRPSSIRPSPHFLAPKAAFPAAGSRTFTSPKGHDGLAKAILSARKSTAIANSTSRFRTLKAINLLTINELRKTRNSAVFPLKLLSPSEKPHFSGLICQENSLFSVQINHQKKRSARYPRQLI